MVAAVGLELEAFTRPIRQVRSASLAQGRLRTKPHAEIPSVAEGPQSWWRRVDSNHGPTDYETVALAT